MKKSTLQRIYRRLHPPPGDFFAAIVHGSVWILASRLANAVLFLLINLWIARRYGAAALGEVAVTSAFLMGVVVFSLFGSNVVVLRLVPEHRVKYSAASARRVFTVMYRLAAAASLGLGVALATGLFVGARLGPAPRLRLLIVPALLLVFHSLTIFQTETLRALQRDRWFALSIISPSLAFLAVLALFALAAPTAWPPVWAQYLSIPLAFLFSRELLRRQSPVGGEAGPIHEVPRREILAICLPVCLTVGLQTFMLNGDVFLLGLFGSKYQAGLYGAAAKLAQLMTFVGYSVTNAAMPRLAELYHGGRIREMVATSQRTSRLILALSLPVGLGLLLLGPYLLSFFGPDFVIAYPALVILVLGHFLQAACGAVSFFLILTGHEKVFRNIVAVATLVSLVLSVWMIPRLGKVGAALGMVAGLAGWNIAAVVYIRRRFGYFISYIPGSARESEPPPA